MALVVSKRHNPFEDDPEASSSIFKRLRCSPIPMDIFSSTKVISRPIRASVSNHLSSTFPDLPIEEISQKILSELGKMIQRRENARNSKLNKNCGVSDSPKNPSGESSCTPRADSKLLTLHQVRTLCSKLLKEREGSVRGEYDRLLNQRLAEQYEQFVKFAQEQLNRQRSSHDEQATSYYS